jgi:ATP-dependent DNA helicase RecG
MEQQSSYFDKPIEYLKGVGPQRGEVLRSELNIANFGDLLSHFPFRYIDRSRFYLISEIKEDLPYIQLKGKISRITAHGIKRTTRMTAILTDEQGNNLELVWFQGIKWVKTFLKTETVYIVFGKPTYFNGKPNIVHPEVEELSLAEKFSGPTLTGVYSTTEKCKALSLDSKAFVKLMKSLISGIPSYVNETLTPEILTEMQLISLRDSMVNIHFPANEDWLAAATKRLKFEELFYLQLRLLKIKANRTQHYQGKPVVKIGEYFNTFYKEFLPFELTNAQKRVLKEIRQDMGTGKQMNRLLQGDVGSGKTMVALLCMLMVMDNGFQACLMAPTEILAAQHFQSISEVVAPLNIKIGLLTGSTKTAHRKFLLEELKNGNINIIIGTHALIEDRVQFNDLGLVVIDEQHRFGVEQRARLWTKDTMVPHVLVMTATPIPRTLAMTLYGDLDTSVIDELPPGRKPITTMHKMESSRLAVFGFMKQQIQLGRQIYVVYPLIEESEKLDYTNLMDGYESICREFPLPDYRVSVVHGRMKPAEKEAEMQRFKEGFTHIMVATTVIEVGVNVPNASVMIIESAERFGLSQLHQLRGRVGRGADQSYCILITGNKLGSDARLRMKTMVGTNNGFEIAEVDLELRGPGDLAGTQQSGVVNLHIADIAKDRLLMERARLIAQKILDVDASLTLPQHAIIHDQLIKMEKIQANFSRVS